MTFEEFISNPEQVEAEWHAFIKYWSEETDLARMFGYEGDVFEDGWSYWIYDAHAGVCLAILEQMEADGFKIELSDEDDDDIWPPTEVD